MWNCIIKRYEDSESFDDAIPHALLCLIMAKVGSLNSDINLIAESTSRRLLYDKSLPFNLLKILSKSPLKRAF